MFVQSLLYGLLNFFNAKMQMVHFVVRIVQMRPTIKNCYQIIDPNVVLVQLRSRVVPSDNPLSRVDLLEHGWHVFLRYIRFKRKISNSQAIAQSNFFALSIRIEQSSNPIQQYPGNSNLLLTFNIKSLYMNLMPSQLWGAWKVFETSSRKKNPQS